MREEIIQNVFIVKSKVIWHEKSNNCLEKYFFFCKNRVYVRCIYLRNTISRINNRKNNTNNIFESKFEELFTIIFVKL